MAEVVAGWAKIAREVGISEDMIKRWCGLYGFPQPINSSRKKRWNRAEVLSWMDKNAEFIKSEQNRCNKYRRLK